MSDPSLSDLLDEADTHFMLAKRPDADADVVIGHLEDSVRFVSPMLPTLVSKPPDGDEWLHEIKYDGFRTQVVINQEARRAFTRHGFDWSDRYAAVLNAAAELDCSSAIIDGEMIVQDAEGRSDFGRMMRAFQDEQQCMVFMGFDLLHINGQDIRSMPLSARKGRLESLIGCHDPSGRIQYVEHLVGGGAAVFNAADQLGLEGIVSKRVRGRYTSGRSQRWLKVKCWAHDQFLVLAVERRKGGPAMALLARENEEGFSVAGWAEITLPGSKREQFWRQVEFLGCPRAELKVALIRDIQPLRPELRVRARYLKGGDKLRHATLSEVC